MAMDTCDTCKFWDQKYYKLENKGSCDNPKVYGHLGDEDDGLYEWEAAEIHSGPKFGCIHHEIIEG